jgi:hypothetical protein
MCKLCDQTKDMCQCGHIRWYHVRRNWLENDGTCLAAGCACESFCMESTESKKP